MEKSHSRNMMNRRTFMKKGFQLGTVIASIAISDKISFAVQEASHHLLARLEVPNAFLIPKEELQKLLRAALNRGGEFAEIYLQYAVTNNLTLDEENISGATRGLSMGAGFRVIQGEKTGYAFSDELEFSKLKEAAETAALIASKKGSIAQFRLKQVNPPSYYQVEVPPETIASKAKAELLIKANAAARSYDKRISEVVASFRNSTSNIKIANSEGLYIEDLHTLSRFRVSTNARDGELKSTSYESKNGAYGFEHFDIKLAEELGKKASETAISLLAAEDAPAGEFPVVIGSGYGGILFHEAIGHSLEGDGIRKKTSCFSDKLGKLIASPIVNLVDDGSYPAGWGTINIDDEGFIGHKTVLIEKGICTGFLYDKLNARLMKMKQTGNGRRESYQYKPIPRMTNTYLLPGDALPEDIIKSVNKGIYVAKIANGNVDWSTGRFVFSVDEGYMIEDGKVTKPLKEITLMGSGPEVLKNITMVGNDLKVIGGGSCVKSGQSVPAGCGNPTLKVSKITIGGSKS